jgi:hypothetical protein
MRGGNSKEFVLDFMKEMGVIMIGDGLATR